MQDGPILLLDEIYIHHIFSQLDLRGLLNAMLTEKQWLACANQPLPWQHQLDHYFPYLKDTHVREYKQAPKPLFFQEAEYYKHWWIRQKPRVTYQRDLALDALEGKAISENAALIKRLFTLAIANGHLYGLRSQLNEEGLILAAKKGHQMVVQDLLQSDDSLSPEICAIALYHAAQRGLLPIVIILTDFPIAVTDLVSAYNRTTRTCCLTIAETLFKRFNNQNYETDILNIDKNKHLQVMSHLAEFLPEDFEEEPHTNSYRKAALALLSINQSNQILPILQKIQDGDFLGHTAKEGCHHILQNMLDNLSNKERAWILYRSAENGQLSIVELLFEHDQKLHLKEQFLSVQKGKALERAAKNGHLKVYQTILEFDQSSHGIKQINSKTKRKAKKNLA